MALFASWEAYWSNVRIGLAFWYDRPDTIQRFDHDLEALISSDWPAAHVGFPGAAIPAWLTRSTTELPPSPSTSS